MCLGPGVWRLPSGIENQLCQRLRRFFCQNYGFQIHRKYVSGMPFSCSGNEQSLAGHVDKQFKCVPKIPLASESHLSAIVRGAGDCGFTVDRYGQLKITSEERSHRRHKTALVLSRVSRSLTAYDFGRILGPLDSCSSGGLEEGFFSHTLK